MSNNKLSQVAIRQAFIAEKQAEIQVIQQLPDGLAVEACFKVGGEWCVVVSGDVNAVLRQMPPLAITIRPDSWTEPAAHRLDRFAADGDICFPVWVAAATGACWATRLPSGLELNVKCHGDAMSLHIPVGYEALPGHHNQFYKRRALPVYNISSHYSPAQVFELNWGQFFEEEGYDSRKEELAKRIVERSRRNQTSSGEDLPGITVEKAAFYGDSLAALGGKVVVLEDSQNSRRSAVVNDFWDVFTPDAAQRLLKFANRMAEPIEEQEDAFAKEAAKQGVALANEFIAKFVKSQRSSSKDVGKVIGAWISGRLGVTINVSIRSFKALGENIQYECWVSCGRWHEGWTFEVPALYDPEGFDWEYPPFVEYDVAGPLFPEQTAVV